MDDVLDWIDGAPVASQDELSFDSFGSASEDVITCVAFGGQREVDRAVTAAATAYADGRWARTEDAQRGRVLRRMAEGLVTRADEFAALENLDTGKPHHLTSDASEEGVKVSGLGEDFGHECLNMFTQLKVSYLSFDGERIGSPSH